jgi:translation initiation factor 2-alpha kinase 4
MRHNLEETFPAARRKLAGPLDELETIISLARACGVTRKILFRPTLSRGAECFRGGFIFECVRRGRGGDAVAFGGRYDSLLDHFKEPATQSRKVYGVGMSLNGE